MRLRNRVRGTAERPRLAVYKSLLHIYAQVIDDEHGTTLVAAASQGRLLLADAVAGVAMRGFPFALAHEGAVIARRPPPVDHPRRIALMRRAVLPELVPQPRPATAMLAHHHGRGQHLGLGQQGRQGLPQRLGAGAQVGG